MFDAVLRRKQKESDVFLLRKGPHRAFIGIAEAPRAKTRKLASDASFPRKQESI
jgi:hypothetical protein